ncbi:MAG: DUF805 domain-containing protein [Pseudomonadota bacterium]
MSNPNAATTADLSKPVSNKDIYQPKFFALEGRIGRLRYLSYSTGVSVLLLVVGMVLALLLSMITPMLGFAALMLCLPAGIALVAIIVRRLHDLDRSGWWAVLSVVPLASLVLSYWIMFVAGSEGSNRYGPAPAANTRGVVAGAFGIPVFVIITAIVAALSIPVYHQYVKQAKAAAPAVPSSTIPGHTPTPAPIAAPFDGT